MYGAYSAALIGTVVDSLPSALCVVNYNGKITDVFISNRRIRHIREKRLFSLLSFFFSTEVISRIASQIEQCIATNETSTIHRISFQTVHGLLEYTTCIISPIPNERKLAIFFRSDSESVLLEQEFHALTEQTEATQRELCVAMSAMDFRLMDLDQSRKKLQVLYEVASIMQRNITENEALEEFVNIITTEFDCSNSSILLLNASATVLEMKAHKGYTECIDVPVEQGITGYAARTREIVYVPDVTKDDRYIPGTPDCMSELAIPLIVSNRVLGVLDIECPAERSLSPYDIDLLRTIAAQAAVAIAHIQHISLIEKVAITDGLTGLYNYHHFCTLLEQEFRRAARYRHTLSLLMIDIDYFKLFNDTYGHVMGNTVLTQVASLINKVCRDVDWVFRYGGEEFAVLLPETSLEEAQEVAERIRSSIAGFRFLAETGCSIPHLSVSVGVASFPTNAECEHDLVNRADIALYSAKRSSKNCVRVYGIEGGEA